MKLPFLVTCLSLEIEYILENTVQKKCLFVRATPLSFLYFPLSHFSFIFFSLTKFCSYCPSFLSYLNRSQIRFNLCGHTWLVAPYIYQFEIQGLLFICSSMSSHNDVINMFEFESFFIWLILLPLPDIPSSKYYLNLNNIEKSYLTSLPQNSRSIMAF